MSNASAAGARDRNPLLLNIVSPDGAKRRIPLKGSPLLIGRPEGTAIRLDSSDVSRRHAELAKDASGNWIVRDLGSRNGTFVDGRPVTEHVLADGDVIHIGGFHLSLVRPVANAPKASAPTLNPVTSTRTGVLVSDAAAGRLSTLKDMEPPRVSAAHLITLNDLSHQFALLADPAARASALCRMMVQPPFCGHWAMLLRLSRADGERQPQSLCEPESSDGKNSNQQQAHVSRSVLRAVLRKPEAVLASNVANSSGGGTNIEMSIAVHVMALAAIACPIRVDADTLDLLYVTLPPQYGTGEWLAMTSLAVKQYQQSEAAWEARKQAEIHAALQHELGQAKTIQLNLLPTKDALDDHRSLGLDVALGFVPSQWVGGDYADALVMKDGRILLIVADVCGHGLAAALVAAGVHTLVHAAVRSGASLSDLGQTLNEHLCQTLQAGAFVTMVGIMLDPRNGSIQFTNAGHPPPIVTDPGGQTYRLAAGENFPLGLDEAPPTIGTGQLASGALLALYSDGLTEQSDGAGAMLGVEGLEANLCEISTIQDAGSEAIGGELSRRLAQRQGAQAASDDMTFILARWVKP
jgi:serine phosphatase RsbU (regulator of sigma subunit)